MCTSATCVRVDRKSKSERASRQTCVFRSNVLCRNRRSHPIRHSSQTPDTDRPIPKMLRVTVLSAMAASVTVRAQHACTFLTSMRIAALTRL